MRALFLATLLIATFSIFILAGPRLTHAQTVCTDLTVDCAISQSSSIVTGYYPVGVPSSWSWYATGHISTPTPPSSWTAITGWIHLYPIQGQPFVSANVYVRNFRTYLHKKTGGWVLVQDSSNSPTYALAGGMFYQDLSGNSADPLPITQLSGGEYRFPTPTSGRMDHFWPNARGTFTANSVDGAFVIAEVRLDDPNANYIMMTAADWWQNASAAYPNNNEVGMSSWMKISTAYQYFMFTTVSKSMLLSDPPPPLVGTGGTPAPTVSIAANPTSVSSGGSSTLTWSSTDATSCTASGGWSGSKATSGTQSLSNLTSTATYTLTCTGAGGTSSPASATVTVTAPGDTQAPSTPTNLTASAVSSSQINLSWSASTDNVGVTGYRVYRGRSLLTTVTGTSYNDTGLSPSSSYT